MSLAKTDVAVCIDNPGQNSRRAWYILRGGLYRLQLCPLQHRLYHRAESLVVTIFPYLSEVQIEIFVLFERGSLQRWILPVSPDNSKFMMLHGGTTVVQKFRQLPDFIHILAHSHRICMNV